MKICYTGFMQDVGENEAKKEQQWGT